MIFLSASSSRPQPLPPQQVRWARLGARHALKIVSSSREPAKWVARLRTVRGEGDKNLSLLKTEMTAGHGGKAGRFDSLDQVTNYRGTSLIGKHPPPRTTIGPQA